MGEGSGEGGVLEVAATLEEGRAVEVAWEEDEETSAEAKATEAVTVGKRIRVEIEEDNKAVGLIGHAMHVVRLVIRNESVLH